MWGGGAVRCHTPSGELVGQVRLPVSQVTACTFGGPDLDELYITTSQQEIDRAEQPVAGALFRVRTGARGLPARLFGGSP